MNLKLIIEIIFLIIAIAIVYREQKYITDMDEKINQILKKIG